MNRRKALIGLVAATGTAWVAAGARGQCAGSGTWRGAFEVETGIALDNTATAVGSWDPDGGGPLGRWLVVGGTFLNAGGVPAARVALFDGAAWRPMGSGGASALPQVALGWDPDGPFGPLGEEAVLGGFFSTMGGVTVRNIAHWNGTTWGGFGAGTQDISGLPDVYAAIVADPDGLGPLTPQLIIGGDFTVAGGASRRRIARWDGAAWQAFGTGMTDSVYCLTTWDPDGSGPASAQIVAGGFFGAANGVAALHVARWDGVTFQSFGPGINGSVETLASWDPDGEGPAGPMLVAGGSFTVAGGGPGDRIAAWNGTGWVPLGAGMNSTVFGLRAFDLDGPGPGAPVLVAAGAFTIAGGVPAGRAAYWDGVSWHALGAGMNNSVFELSEWDADGEGPNPPALVAGGSFTQADGLPANRLALWPACAGVVCDPDVNADGNVDQGDVDYLIDVVGGGANPSGIDPDFNRDGNVDQGDVDALLDVVAGGACP